MSDPRLVYRDDATGEGIFEDDAGVRTSVHLPSLSGMPYVDATQPAVESIDPSTYSAPAVSLGRVDAIDRMGAGAPVLGMPGAPVIAPDRSRAMASLEAATGPTLSTTPAPMLSMPASVQPPAPPRIHATHGRRTSTPTDPLATYIDPSRVAPSMTPPIARRTIDELSVAPAFDETIADLSGRPAPTPPPDIIDRQTQIAQRQAQLAGDDARRQQHVIAASEDERRGIETERREAVSQAQGRYQSAIDRVSNARLDPNAWFRDQGAFGTVGATIAVALGALGSALQGSSTNGALEQINAAIDRDLDAQRSEIDAGSRAADLQGNMLSIVGQEFSDRDAARLAAQAAMLSQAQLELQRYTADLSSEEALVNADVLRGQLAAAQQEAEQDAIDRESERGLRAAQARRFDAQAAVDMRAANRPIGGGPSAPPRVTPTMLDAYHRLVQDGVPEAEASQRAGLAGLTPELHTEVTQAEGNVAALEGSLSYLESIIPQAGVDIPGMGRLDSLMPAVAVSDEGLVLRRAVEDVVELYSRLHSGGAITDTESARFVRLVGAGAGMSDDDLRRGIAALRRETDARSMGTPQRGAAADRDRAEFGARTVSE